MKFICLTMSYDEAIFYRQGVFTGEDDLLIFSLDDFLKFREYMKEYLGETLKIVDVSKNNSSRHGPGVDAQRIINWIKKMEIEIEKLNQTDIQKNLSSYK
ncbi:hypothetical protein [Methanobacterium alcaliphilum]|uniref:hypothetical protein n=1 Tax=Methanobacterium alcaliphilum TaxID=392018 RepID=UPI00200AF269|nr:hypothetical protein [Methanobacterium alcaliphilum]MCK9150602.1 hypothetical protein [Methanobacterium alcaliphilum]